MKSYWILLLIFPALALASCSDSQLSNKQLQLQPVENARPQIGPLQEPPTDSPESNPDLPQLPAPTVGSVVITNTMATPLSSEISASALAPTPALQELAEEAREDLANRLNISIDQIDFLKVVPAKWPYDNVGCPLPNGESIDTSTPGYQVLLKARGQQYMYHTNGKNWIDLCNIKPPNEIRTLP